MRKRWHYKTMALVKTIPTKYCLRYRLWKLNISCCRPRISSSCSLQWSFDEQDVEDTSIVGMASTFQGSRSNTCELLRYAEAAHHLKSIHVLIGVASQQFNAQKMHKVQFPPCGVIWAPFRFYFRTIHQIHTRCRRSNFPHEEEKNSKVP